VYPSRNFKVVSEGVGDKTREGMREKIKKGNTLPSIFFFDCLVLVAADLEAKKRELEILKEEVKTLNFEVTKQTQV
jgi:hypothetical protein